MAEPIILCVPCKRRGLVNVAHRIVNGQGMCRECYEGKPVAPVTLAANPSNPVTIVRKEEPMRKANVDWNAVRTERAQGVTVRELAEKFHVSEANIYLHSRGKGKSRAGGGKKSSRLSAVVHDTNANSGAIGLPEEVCNKIWSLLSLERRQQIIHGLLEKI